MVPDAACRVLTTTNAVGFLYFDIDKERDWAIYENGTLPVEWQQGMQSAQTTYQHPLENWFTPGQLIVDTASQVYPGCIGDIEKSQFQFEIKWLISTEITVGCGNSLFCPTRAVTRGQMASFLARALNLPSPQPTTQRRAGRSMRRYQSGCCRHHRRMPPASYCPGSVTTRLSGHVLTRSLGLPSSPTTTSRLLGSVHGETSMLSPLPASRLRTATPSAQKPR